MAYCAVSDLLYGDIPITGTQLSPAKFVDDAADEINSKIGFRYAVPVSLSAPAPVLLLLKRLNAHIATGRLIMAAAASGSANQNHSYGLYLVREALFTLRQIENGDVDLPGLAVSPLAEADPSSTPIINNLDETSHVEDFYKSVTNSTTFRSPYPYSGG